MKNIYLVIGSVVIFINSIIGLIFTSYSTFNWVTSDIIIIINTFLLHSLVNSRLSDGFKVSLSFIYPILGLIEFAFSVNLENKLENNFLLACLIVFLSIQIILLIIANSLKTIKK